MKKIISLFLAVMMSFSVFILPSVAQAAEPINITVNGVMVDSIVSPALQKTNETRTRWGLEPLTLDGALTEQARVRVTEILFRGRAVDSVEDLPDGNTIYTRFPSYGNVLYSDYGRLGEATADKLDAALTSFAYGSASEYKSIGIAVFNYDNKTFWYALASKQSATQPFTSRENFNYSRTVTVAPQYITGGGFSLEKVNEKGAYNLVATLYFDGQLFGGMEVPYGVVTFKSSAPSKFKVKGGRGYAKKNGKATVSVCDTHGSPILTQEVTVYGNNTTPSWDYKYPKAGKKKITCKWVNYYNASGYQIQYSTKKNMKGAKTLTVKGNKKQGVVKKLKSKKTYYVRFRLYINQGDGEKQYSNWSKKVKVKVK